LRAELIRAHGGEIRLVDGTIGATFRIIIPGPRGRTRRAARGERQRA
jgi:signal transduction histidine kinase